MFSFAIIGSTAATTLKFVKYFLMKSKLNFEEKGYKANSVKYLGIRIDKFLNCHDQVKNIAAEFNRADTLLLKIRNYVKIKTLRKIYFAIFNSHLTYSSIVWAQNTNTVDRLIILQKFISLKPAFP